MPILHLGSVKTSPIPRTMQADVPSKPTFVWQNAKEDDGAPYSIDDLIEDITKPLEAAVVPGAKNFGIMGNNSAISNFIKKLKDPSILTTEKQAWISKWKEAFAFNPTYDISQAITDMIKTNLGTIKDGIGWLSQAFAAPDGDATLMSLIKDGVTKFFSGLQASMPAFIDIDQIETEMETKVSDDIKSFHLDINDDGLVDVKNLVADSIKTLATRFESAKYASTTPNRPYRVFSQTDAKNEVSDVFETKFHTQSISDEIVAAAFKKATAGDPTTNKGGASIKNLKEILGNANGVLDSRFIEVLKGIKTLSPKLQETPVEIFEKLLGKTTGDAFLKWYDQWNWLIQVSHEESTLSKTSERVVMHLEVKDGVKVIPAEGTKYPDVFVVTGGTKLEASISTPDLPISSVSYMTDVFKSYYDAEVKDTSKGTVSEDDLASIFGAGLLKDGQFVEGITYQQIDAFDPTGLSSLSITIKNGIKAVADNLKNLYGFTYDELKLAITFKVTYHNVDGKETVSIVPEIVDKNVETLPGIDWKPSSKTSPAVQAQINGLFNTINGKHEKLDYSDFVEFSQDVVAPIDNATKALRNIFDKHKIINGDSPFKMDVIGDLTQGAVIPLSNFEDVFQGLKSALEKFDSDNKSRFTVEYKIKELNEKNVVIGYTVTDTTTKQTRTKTMDNKELDNISIQFNESLDKAQALLVKLQKSKIDRSDFATRKQVEDFAKRSPLDLTTDELKKMFPEFQSLVNEGQGKGITLTPGKVHGVTDKDGNSVYFKHFGATFKNAKGDGITRDIEIQITHNFLSQDEIDKANAQIDGDAAAASETIQNSVLSDDEKKSAQKVISATHDALKQEIQKQGQDMSEEKLKDILGSSEAMPKTATAASVAAKYKEVHGLLEKQFPNGVPPEIEQLFKEKWKGFEDIIKNNPGILNNIEDLKKLLKGLDGKSLMNAKKTMQLSGKIALLSLGGILGIGAGIGGANAIKVATTNKKAINARTGKIKSSKKLAILSALIGLASAGGSIATLLYLFLAQGGL